MISIGICDDEKNIRKELAADIKNILDCVGLDYCVSEYESGEEFLDRGIKEIDLVFMDILMGEINGFDTAKKLREKNGDIELIFLTSIRDYVQVGYEVRAYRYITKPYKKEDIESSLLTCIKEIVRKKGRILKLDTKDGIIKIKESNIMYVEAMRKHIVVNFLKTRVELNMQLKDIKNQLDPDKFIDCHRSFIVNMDYVFRINSQYIVLDNGNTIPIGRTKYKYVKEKIFWYLGEDL